MHIMGLFPEAGRIPESALDSASVGTLYFPCVQGVKVEVEAAMSHGSDELFSGHLENSSIMARMNSAPMIPTLTQKINSGYPTHLDTVGTITLKPSRLMIVIAAKRTASSKVLAPANGDS